MPDDARGSAVDADLLAPDVPIHAQLYRQLRAEILDGIWVDRDDFPGERELAERFGVSVITSRAALDRLARDELVVRSRGRRTRSAYRPVRPAPRRAPRVFPPVGTEAPFTYEVVRSGVSAAPAEACWAYGLEPGAELWQAIRIALLDGRPFGVFQNVQRPEIGLTHSADDLRTKPMVSILREEDRPIATVARTVQATTAPPDAARHLGLDLHAPILLIVLRASGADGQLLEWTRLYMRPDEPLAEEVVDLNSGRWSTADP
jgi:GntR family transcriptional regulator